ncbi:hypothetical protein D0864_05906 [Hortaea werneckii]|uniref:Acyl-CoA dehydrogenase/oxidase C-terminal domain-containing protein n=1 Tax=Hortaea werneckii TaxID=91943 RepID=A0A3M7FU39_HORWE|nr:hypothetical protein D0864_05906 [Hortaea werneckii]
MPSEYGGSELGLADATVMMQTIAESGGGYTASSSVHMNIFGLAPVVKYGNEEQKKRFLVPLIEGKERACFAVTEPNTGLDTLRLQSLATRDGDGYVLKGSKIWTSTAQVAEKILILVRTTALEDVKKPSEGLTLFYTDLDRTQVSVTEIKKMGRAAVDTNQLYFDGWRIPAADRIGNEGEGFKMIMHGMNAERILLSGEAVGIGYAALRHASNYARERIVFGRPIGKNQGISHPLAKSWCQLESTRLMIMQAAKMWDEGYASGEYANAVKYLAGENAFTACETAVCSMGGMGYAKEYHVERFLREVIIPRLAPDLRSVHGNRLMCAAYQHTSRHFHPTIFIINFCFLSSSSGLGVLCPHKDGKLLHCKDPLDHVSIYCEDDRHDLFPLPIEAVSNIEMHFVVIVPGKLIWSVANGLEDSNPEILLLFCLRSDSTARMLKRPLEPFEGLGPMSNMVVWDWAMDCIEEAMTPEIRFDEVSSSGAC